MPKGMTILPRHVQGNDHILFRHTYHPPLARPSSSLGHAQGNDHIFPWHAHHPPLARPSSSLGHVQGDGPPLLGLA